MDQPFEIVDRRLAQLDLSQRLEPVERDRRPGTRLPEAELGSLEGALDAVEQLDHAPGIDIGLVDCAREQGSRERPLLDVGLLGQESQLLGVLRVEGDVQACPLRSHKANPTRKSTTRVRALCEQGAVCLQHVQDAVDVVLDVVQVERDAHVRVALRADDPLGCECGDERVHVGGADTDERASP